MKVPEYDEEWGDSYINRLREYMETLEASVDEDRNADEFFEVETLSGAPYCGCEDCVEREYGLMSLKLAIEGYEAGKVRLVDV